MPRLVLLEKVGLHDQQVFGAQNGQAATLEVGSLDAGLMVAVEADAAPSVEDHVNQDAVFDGFV